MSKASAWAEYPTFPRVDLFWRGEWSEPRAYPVLFSGKRIECVIIARDDNGGVRLTTAQALDLARWIIDTLGEPQP